MNNEFNNQGNQQVISIEKKQTNILAILGLIFAFFLPLVGLVLSIIGLVQAKKLNDGKGIAIGGIIASAIFFVLHIIFIIAFIFVLVFEEIDDYDYDYDYNYYHDNIDYSYFGDREEKFYLK